MAVWTGSRLLNCRLRNLPGAGPDSVLLMTRALALLEAESHGESVPASNLRRPAQCRLQFSGVSARRADPGDRDPGGPGPGLNVFKFQV